MDMRTPPGNEFGELFAFHLSGRRAPAIEPIDGLDLRPALFARFGDLTRLRYDYPLILAEGRSDAQALMSLSAALDALLRELAPRGPEGERLRATVLRLERELRVLLTEGAQGRLSTLWMRAAERVVARGGTAADADLLRARSALTVDGTLLDCGERSGARVVEHLWRAVEEARRSSMRRAIDGLAVRLADLIRADHLRSEAGRSAQALRAGVGERHKDLFDFGAMAQLLAKPSGPSALPPARRARMEAALQVLRTQRFFPPEASAEGYGYLFDHAEKALDAWRERLPAMAELVKAISIAELETDGRYVAAKHDATFADFGVGALRPEDLALFPRMLVRVAARDGRVLARAGVTEALASGVPLKIVVEVGELLDSVSLGEEHYGFGARLATSALGLNDVYVVQSTASQLYRMRERLHAALRYTGPALVSVYTGAGTGGGTGDRAGRIPPYLVAAAAMQSRAFPAFSHDPSAGEPAERFALEGNPQPDSAWPVHALDWADEALQRIRSEAAFTFADFMICDPRHARHFARVLRERGNGAVIAAGDWLARGGGTPEAVPAIDAVDADNRLHRLIVDERVMVAARRCAETWQQLQQLERMKRKPAAAPAAEANAAAAPSATPAPAPAATAEASAPAGNRDEAYIETERCTTCNECTQINSSMFVYNANKQASIANPDAGTYRQLVEAAESCQVSIIHPGKPRNPKEPGLEELLQRAEPFR